MRDYVNSHETTTEKTQKITEESEKPSTIGMKLYYCRQCGYICFREDSPYVCPICKAKREMFNEIKINADIKR